MNDNPYQILIVEDELIIAEVLKEMLVSMGHFVVGIAKNYDKAIGILEEHTTIDLALLDINLGGEKSGIDIGTEINNRYKFPIVYVSSYADAETISSAGKTRPEAYLIKPFKKEDIFATIEILKARTRIHDKPIILKDGYDMIRLDLNDIFYVKSEGNYLEVHTDSRKHLVRMKIEEFISENGEDHFIQIHRSYAVNVHTIDAITGHYALVGKKKLPISRKFKDHFIERFKK